MKKQLLITAIILFAFFSCTSNKESEKACGTYNGKTLYRGEKGGCYYYNSSNNKEYVDRSNCKCF